MPACEDDRHVILSLYNHRRERSRIAPRTRRRRRRKLAIWCVGGWNRVEKSGTICHALRLNHAISWQKLNTFFLMLFEQEMEDVSMEDAPQLVPREPKPRAPVVDDDGFQMVSRKGRGRR